MGIKITTQSRLAKTYLLGRACQYCGEPIEDQARATKIHCSRYIDEFGVTHDCKRRKNQLKNQPLEEILLDWCARQRQTKGRIEDAVTAHGDELAIEILDAYNIQLADCIRFYHQQGLTTLEFLGYNIIKNNNRKTFKIQKNDQSRVSIDPTKAA